jgi:hypothetical protein
MQTRSRPIGDYYGNPAQSFPYGLNNARTDDGTDASPAQKWPFGLNNRRSLGCAGCAGGCGSCGGKRSIVLGRGLGRRLGQSDPYFDPVSGADVFNPSTLQPVATDQTLFANPLTNAYQSTPVPSGAFPTATQVAGGSSIGGIPLTYILGGGAALMVLVALASGRRR